MYKTIGRRRNWGCHCPNYIKNNENCYDKNPGPLKRISTEEYFRIKQLERDARRKNMEALEKELKI